MTAFEEDAIQVDAYLDGLLASRGRDTPRLLALPGDEPLDPDLASAAQAVRRTMLRFHPSFRFEERLAERLRLASEPPSTIAVTEPIVVAAFAGAPATAVLPRAADSTGLELRGRGGLLIGGAIASGVSIAGAAVIAWRRARAEHRWEHLA